MNYKDPELVEALLSCGVRPNDVVLVHSNISFFKGNLVKALYTIYDSILDVITKNGTLCVPAYLYEYSRENETFDIASSKSSIELGLFSRFILWQGDAKRSLSPLCSIASIGYYADYICGGNTTSSYGTDSAFDRLYKMNAKMLFIGVDCRYMTFVHYVEWHTGVPHLYTKLFDGKVYKDDKEIDLPVCQQVRFRNSNVKPDGITNTDKFEKAGIVKFGEYKKQKIRCVTCGDAFYHIKTELQKDPYYLLKEPMKYKDGEPIL